MYMSLPLRQIVTAENIGGGVGGAKWGLRLKKVHSKSQKI